jgi:hypothetical protein
VPSQFVRPQNVCWGPCQLIRLYKSIKNSCACHFIQMNAGPSWRCWRINHRV